MADVMMTASPLPAQGSSYDGVTIAPAPAMRRYALRARDAAELAGVIGRTLPERIGQDASGVIQIGPDEYYALLGAADSVPLGEGRAVSVVDVSSRAVGIVIEGPRAVETIMAGCPLDMEAFAVGRGTRTVFETVEIVLRRDSETRFHIEVWRSFAPWLWQALCEAAHG
ncbi:sarcosine oxidase subunit gamma [Novosphingobium sp. CCH12-A3]|uniref:sarcosine oxidase subunit gamma n=1 Tax=Novosphingobium sp. CCH12-A3 TaxID=1768752 RepID=UPI000785078E|nr:sarcosine oxidase subunit gamma family protein [Novosphingobium sp. CCH12-A3]